MMQDEGSAASSILSALPSAASVSFSDQTSLTLAWNMHRLFPKNHPDSVNNRSYSATRRD